MEDQFVPYELAVKLKEMGFDEECLKWFDDNGEFVTRLTQRFICKAPLYQQAFDWFERYNLYGRVDPTRDGWYYYILEKNPDGSYDKKTFYNNFSSDKKWCQVACLGKLIEIIENGG